MTMSRDSASNFCLFCYKKIESSVEIVDSSKLTTKFINVVTQFSKRGKLKDFFSLDCPLEILLTVGGNLLESCKRCQILIKSFCEKYEQLMVLEMELDWKLEKLKDKMQYANKVPARWIHVSRILEKVFPNDLEKKDDGQNSIKTFRQTFINTALQKRQQSQPRIFLRRLEDDERLFLIPRKTTKAPNFKNSPLIENSSGNSETDDKANVPKLGQHYKNKKCPKCGNILKPFGCLEKHQESHKDSKEWKLECSKCGKKYYYRANLKVHKKSHAIEKPYKCRYCGQRLCNRHSYQKHLKAHHKNEEGFEQELNKKFEISVAQTRKTKRLKSKVKKANNTRKRYKCPKCEKSLASLKGFNVHFKLHNNQNTEKCRQCGKEFTSKGNLTVHMRSHTGELPFKCGFCGKHLRYRGNLNRHLKTMHRREKNLEKELKRRLSNKPIKCKKLVEDKSKNLNESTAFPENDEDMNDIKVDNQADDHLSNDEYFNEETSTNEDENVVLIEKADTNVTFDEPLIKVEPSSFINENMGNEDPLQNSPTSLHYNGFGSHNSNDLCAENINEKVMEKREPISAVHSTTRYSLREKRNTKFTSFEGFDTENEDNDD